MATRELLISLVSMSNRELLRRCLRSIPAACGDLSYDVAIVDNVSTDGSVEMVSAEFPWARVSRNPHRLGFSANHNQNLLPLLQSGSHAFVCILNEDTELDPGSLRALVEACRRDPTVGVAGPRIRGTGGESQASLLAFPSLSREIRRSLLRTSDEVTSGGWLNGSCLVLSLETLRRVGPLDQRFFLFFEDTDLSRRLADSGLAAVIVSKATMLHHGHSTVARPEFGSAMERQMLRSRYLYYRKHLGRRQAALAMLIVKAELTARAAKAALLGSVCRRPDERDKRDLLLSLVQSDPKRHLDHEISSVSAVVGSPAGGADG